MVNTVDLLFMFVLLPVPIGSDSKPRIGRISWEWIIFGFPAMSLFAALLQDVLIPLWFQVSTGSAGEGTQAEQGVPGAAGEPRA